MKKVVYACVLIIAIIFAFVLGMTYANRHSTKEEDVGRKDDVVGVYQTDSWNGKIGTLVLYEDGTCLYPTGASATWEADEEIVYIMLDDQQSTSASEAKIMENGLVLYEKFFIKVSD